MSLFLRLQFIQLKKTTTLVLNSFFSVILIGLIFLPKDSLSTTEIETSSEESYDPFYYKPESPDRFEIMTQISLFISNAKVNAGLGCYFDIMC